MIENMSPFLLMACIFGVIFVTFVGYIIIRCVITATNTFVSVSAVCCNNIASQEQRFVDNRHYDRIERARSVAYSGEYVTLYTSVFRYTYNGMVYEAKSNVSKDAPLEVGSVHQLKINPKNPTEIRTSH